MGSDAWLADFCSRIKKQFDWPFMARLMPRFITEDRIKILRDGGLEHVSIGLQGSDRLNSELYSRQEDSQSFINACKTIGNFGILPVVDVIMDNPYETETDLKEITKILNSIPKPFTVLTYSLTLFPSTDIYNKARLDGMDKKFGTDAYKSAVIASRSGGYVTPLVWRRLIETVVSQAPSGVIKDILDCGVSGKKNVAKINKLYRRYSFRVKFVNRLRNFNPLLFRILLKIYRAWQKIKI
jgi:radical SAM superfamily enzyme YgiQ (UPF0313 family)